MRKMKVKVLFIKDLRLYHGNTRCGKLGCVGGLMDNGSEWKSERRVQLKVEVIIFTYTP